MSLAVVVTACDSAPLVPEADLQLEVAPSMSVTAPGHEFFVCKEGAAGSFSFSIAATGGDLPLGDEFTVTSGSCVVPWEATTEDWVELTITELDDAALERVEVTGYHDFTTTESTIAVLVTNYWGGRATFFNGETSASGRMTGGGHQLRVDGVRVTRGLTLHCDVTLSNNLEVNWAGGNKWHLEKESLENVSCIDDPNYDPFPPEAPFDTFIARAIGSLNGVDGSVVDFKFIDDGEPGRSDEAYITIYEPNLGPGQVIVANQVIALEVGGTLDGGNLQAHFDQPHN